MVDEPGKQAAPPAPVDAGAADRVRRQSLADYEEDLLHDEARRVERKRRLLTGLGVAVLLVGGATGFLLYQARTKYLLEVTPAYLYHDGVVELAASVRLDRPGKLRLGADVREVIPDRDLRFSWSFPVATLQLGENRRSFELTGAEGKSIARKDVLFYKDFDVQEDRSGVDAAPHQLLFRFALPPGWKLRAEGQQLEGASAVLVYPLQQVFEQIDGHPDPSYAFELRLQILRPDGSSLNALRKVEVPLPATSLQVDSPAEKLTVLAEATATVRGRAEPGATVSVGGAAVAAGADGAFAARVELGKASSAFALPAGASTDAARQLAEQVVEKQGVEVEVVADAPQKVARSLYFNFLRVRAEDARRYREAVGRPQQGMPPAGPPR